MNVLLRSRSTGIVLIAIAISTLVRPLWWFGGHAFFALLLIIAGVCVALTLVLFVAFKITLSSGASDLQRSAVETKG